MRRQQGETPERDETRGQRGHKDRHNPVYVILKVPEIARFRCHDWHMNVVISE